MTVGQAPPAEVIHISTAPLIHTHAGAEQRLCSNPPQAYAQVVILSAKRAQTNTTEHELTEKACDIALHTLLQGGQEVTLTRFAH